MSEKLATQLDLRGLTCPEPVIRTKKVFDKQDVNEVEAWVDDDVCVNNLSRLAISLKAKALIEKEDGYYRVVIRRSASPVAGAAGASTGADGGADAIKPTSSKHANADHATPSAAASTQTASGQASSVGTVLFLCKDTFGEGDPELSKTLTNLFLQTVFDSGLRPRAILMANSGVKLMAKNSQVLPVLEAFKNEGVEVLACGLCLDFYKLKEEVPTAQITNMFAICEYLFAADKVLQP